MVLKTLFLGVLAAFLVAAQAQGIGDTVPAYRTQRQAGQVRLYSDIVCPRGPDGEPVVCGRPLTDQGRRALHEFGRCLVRRDAAGSRASLAVAIEGGDYRASLEGLVSRQRGCAASGALSFSAGLIYGVIAEALLETGGSGDALVARLKSDPGRSPVRAANEIEYLAFCTALTSPAEAVRLLSAPPATDEELQAFRALVQRMSACVAAGEELRPRRPLLRSALAIAAYRLTAHPLAAR
ncbi:hypothetical protein E2493_15780 [Sphingomonas parva]|uniref:Uncharacterized protein n=1 Tax=Sphingomonas parva TaxID=2555898 RepID=A0A4Y8ZMZ1_9SPHN|nr:hypothetical protein [Sphingomonas parva]TFI57324.1 hypothetical protein E2493_15780 [Sphingomonas parva]